MSHAEIDGHVGVMKGVVGKVFLDDAAFVAEQVEKSVTPRAAYFVISCQNTGDPRFPPSLWFQEGFLAQTSKQP